MFPRINSLYSLRHIFSNIFYMFACKVSMCTLTSFIDRIKIFTLYVLNVCMYVCTYSRMVSNPRCTVKFPVVFGSCGALNVPACTGRGLKGTAGYLLCLYRLFKATGQRQQNNNLFLKKTISVYMDRKTH